MTNQSDACLTAESMACLAHGELTAADLACLEEHISACESCRNILESSSLDAMWRDSVLPVLQATSEDCQKLDHDKSDGHDEQSLESLLKLLGPTDDPHKLGRIGTYEVIGVIGRGGMGVVFKAFDAALNRFVAIKMLLPHLAASGAARKRFAREGQAAAAVIDDNVLPIYSVAEWQGVPYLVTQYSRGTTLQKRIQDQGSLELKEILRIGMQTARGLAAAHAQGLVHRDVKPSNILLDGTVERALLTDFGLARAVDDASITRTGVIAGTPQYMSPEQARGGSVDARSDLFGLGGVLYTMCTGRPPFRAENSYAVLRLITDAEPRPIRAINPEIPEWLCRLINRLMAKSPNDRFTTAAEVSTLLEQCLAHVQHPTVAPVPEQLRVEKTASQRMRITRSMVAIGALLIGLLGLFGFVIRFQSQDGTLLIESSVDDVTVRVSQGDTVVRKLTVTKAGTRIDVAAGNYIVEIEGEVDGIAIANDKVNLRRGETEIVKLTYQRPPEPTRASNLGVYKSSQDVQHIIERTILYVTEVRAVGQVLYFKLHRRGDEPPVNARLKIESLYEKPVPFVWSGPIDADIDVMPGGVSEISLPLIPTHGTKVAVVFLDDQTAISAAKQLSSIGDRSLLLEQQANLGTGGQKRDGVIHGVHPKGGRYSIEFSIVFDSTTASSINNSGIQRPQFTSVNWRPMYLAIATHLHTAKRHSLTESQQQEIRKLFDEFVRTATVETHDELLELTQAKMEAVLTREQDESVRREIWLGWNTAKFRDPKRLAQLQISDEQQRQIDAIWQALELQTGAIQDPSASPNLPEPFRPRRFAVEGPEQWQRVFDEAYAILTNQQRSKFLSEIQDPIVDGLLTDARQRALAVPKGVVREFLSPLSAEMEAAFPTVNWRQLYIGRAMESQLAKWHQVTPEQLQQMHEISQTFLREATPANRETEEKRAQSAIQALLSPEQDQLLRKEIWLAVNASRLRSSAVHDQLGLDIHQRRQIEEAFEKFESEVRQNNGWMADGTDSHQSLFDDILAVLTAKQREMYYLKLQDPVFSTTPPGPLPRDWKAEDIPARGEDPNATNSRNSANHEEARINRPRVDADDIVIYATAIPDVRIVRVAVDDVSLLLTLAEKVPGEKDWSVAVDFESEQWADVAVRSTPDVTRTFVRPVTAAAKTWLTQTHIPLPFGENGKVIALIFPTEQSAEAAAKLIQSRVMDDLRQTREIAYPGSDGDKPLLEGLDEQLGQYHVRLRLDFTWSRPDPFPLMEAPGVIGRDQAYVELVNSLPPNIDPWLTAEQTEKFREMKSQVQSEGTSLTQQAYANWKEAIRDLLTEPQHRRLEQLIWQRYGCLAFLQPDLQTQLKMSPAQIKAIQDAWLGHFSKIQRLDEGKSEEIPDARTRTAKEIDSAKQAWLTIYAVLNSSQRFEFDSIRGERYPIAQPQAANGETEVDTSKKPLLEVGDQSGNQGKTSSRLIDVLNADIQRERERFPLLDLVLEDVRLMEGGGLEILEKPVKEDREQYAKDHPDLAKAFSAWQSDYRDVIRVTEGIPELFDKNNNAHEMMVTVAKLLIESEDIPGVSKERLAEAHKLLGENPTDEAVEKLFLELAKDRLFNLQRQLRESGANVTHTGMHEDHLRIAEKARIHIEFARLYCAIEHSEMFRQIRKLQESVDPTTVFLFEERHPIEKDATLVFISSRGREEVRAGERGYHTLAEPSATVTGKVADQEFRPKNANAVQVTHVIIDRRTDGMVAWRCYGIPAGSTASKTQEGSSESSSAPDGDTEQKDTKAILGPRQYRLAVTRLVNDTNQLVVTLRIEAVKPQWFEIWSGENYWHRGSQKRWIANLADERSADGRYFSKLLTFTATQIASDNKRLTRLTLQGTSIVYDLPLDWAVDKSLLITAKDGVYEFLHPLVIGTLANQTELKLCVGERESVEAISLTSDRNRMVGDSLNAVLPSESIVDLNVLANSTEEAKVRMANRRLRDPNASLLADLQGTWLMTAIVAPDGTIESVSDPVGAGHSVHFKDSTVAFYQGNDQEPLPLKFTIDASRPTPEIDIEGHDGIFTLGLIETQKGTLYLQLGEAGGKRPSDSIKPAVHYQFRRIPASLVALGEQETKDALNLEEVQQQEAVIREANRQLKDPNAVLIAELQGKWILTGMATPQGFGAVSNPFETGHAIEFDKTSVVIHQGPDAESDTGTYVIDASTNPVEIDIKGESRLFTLGLIELKNGTLDLRLGDAGGDRPSDAITPAMHFRYRRLSASLMKRSKQGE